jgi:hypothetical protein
MIKINPKLTIRQDGWMPFYSTWGNRIHLTKETVEAIVGGLLNLGDVASAITVVQDCFNQYSVLPPYTTHLKILEFALGRGLIYEAKRHVYFIQQLWKWESNEYHSKEFIKLVTLTQKNPKLSKEAVQKLFAYFGERLDDSDFFWVSPQQTVLTAKVPVISVQACNGDAFDLGASDGVKRLARRWMLM